MELKTGNTEQLILEVAEKLFIEKGYTGTRTAEIANEAGVNQALLHYYFRTKENLFNQIFEQKATQLLECFSMSVDNDSAFFEELKAGIEAHFEILSKSPGLPLFILREVVSDKNRKDFIMKNLLPTGMELYKKLKVAIRREARRGRIRPVRTFDLLFNVVSLNVFAFVAAQLLFDTNAEEDQKNMRKFLEERKRNNIKLIINSLKP